MRVRNVVLIAVAFLTLTLGLTGCAAREARVRKETPVPTKTLRPTFTATIQKPTLTPSPTAADSGGAAQQPAGDAAPTAEPPTPTTEPTPEPSPTPEPAAFTVSSASINVRSGPGTIFPVIGRLTNGQSYPITGKNDDGSWWQFDYNGQSGWVIGSNVAVTSGDAVQVAANIPAAPPTPKPQPRPTARPAAPKPAAPAQPAPQPAAPATRFALAGTTLIENTNDLVTVYCLKFKGSSTQAGTLRVTGPAGSAEKSFPAEGTWYLQFPISRDCKVELSPAANGTYTAVLIENGQPVSDPFTFTVNGTANRTAIIGWSEK